MLKFWNCWLLLYSPTPYVDECQSPEQCKDWSQHSSFAFSDAQLHKRKNSKSVKWEMTTKGQKWKWFWFTVIRHQWEIFSSLTAPEKSEIWRQIMSKVNEVWIKWLNISLRIEYTCCSVVIWDFTGSAQILFLSSLCVLVLFYSSVSACWSECFGERPSLWRTNAFAPWTKSWPASNSLRCMHGRSLLKRKSQVHVYIFQPDLWLLPQFIKPIQNWPKLFECINYTPSINADVEWTAM